MKTPFRPPFKLVPAIALALLLQGCMEETDSASPPAEVANQKAAPKAGEKQELEEKLPEPAGPKPVEALPNLSPGLAEVIKLAQARVGDQVLLAFIQKSEFAFNPTVEEILYLHDIGVSQVVITDIVMRGKKPAEMAAMPEKMEPVVLPGAEPQVKTDVPPIVPPPGAAAKPGGGQAGVPVVAEQPEQPVEQPQTVVQTPVYPAEIAVAPQPVQYFYNTLSPYGTWVNVNDYGWCWQPSVAVIDVSWRPYHSRGRWLWTNHGWYWQSDYSWGWAAFHHGRWFRHNRFGWCWQPDLVWGPSWVSWRYTDAYCGWAPLPPGSYYRTGIGFSWHSSNVGIHFDFGLGYDHYSFIPTRYFCEPDPWRYCLPRHNVRNVFVNSTVINNYIIGDNNIIINDGVGFDRVATRTRSEIRRVEVRDIPPAVRSGVAPDRVVPDGATLAVYRPSDTRPRGETPLTRSTQEIRRPGTTTEPAARPQVLTSLESSRSASKASVNDRPGNSSLVSRPRPSPSPITRAEPSRPGSSISTSSPGSFGAGRPVAAPTPLTAPKPITATPLAPAVSSLAPERNEPQRPSIQPKVAVSQPTGSQRPITAPQTLAPPTVVQPQAPARPSAPISRSEPQRPPSITVQRPAENRTTINLDNNRPTYSSPGRPAEPSRSYTPPSAPTYSAPSRPQFVQPSAPSYSRPSAPSYSPPSRPSAPSYSPPAPSFSRPTESRPSAPPTSGFHSSSRPSTPPVNNSPPPVNRPERR
ncbi:MAG: DUF6600 domain-containing protein [Verrucomicrobiota bacterium]